MWQPKSTAKRAGTSAGEQTKHNARGGNVSPEYQEHSLQSMYTLQRVSYVETEAFEVPGVAYAEANVEDIGPCGVRFREVGSGRKGDNTIKVSRGGLRPNRLIMSGYNTLRCSWSFPPTREGCTTQPPSHDMCSLCF